jgi:hypothetical protein
MAEFLCLSSGSRPRYRRDIARALSLPTGMRIQFRYARKWIDPSILSQIDERKQRKKLRGASCLIAYVDQAPGSGDVEIVPCRFAKLVDAVTLGQTVTLQLAVAEFAFAADLASVNDALRSQAGGSLPHRVDGDVEGLYWFELSKLPELTSSSEFGAWENIIEEIAVRPDFIAERFFYAVQGLVDVSTDKPLRPAKHYAYNLRSNRDYDLRMYHFHPTEGNPDAMLGATVSGVPVSFTVTPEVLLDSRYDINLFRFRTGSPVTGERGVLTVRRRQRGAQDWEWEFDLPLRVRGALVRRLGFGLLVGTFLAVTPVVAAYSNSKLSAHNQLIVALVGALASYAAGITAAFGLRRSL